MGKRIRVPKRFIPKEAHAIAADFRSAAAQVRDVARQLDNTGGVLEGSWQGNSKETFMTNFRLAPGDLDNYATWLDKSASEIESIEVTIWEWKEVDD